MEKYVLLTLLLLLFSCGESSDTAGIVAEETPTDRGLPTATPKDTCRIDVETMPGNRYVDYLAGERVLLRMDAENNWLLEVYRNDDCTLKANYRLPENYSPDFPYFLADINYNTSQRMVGIRGYNQIFVADLEQGTLSEPIVPNYKVKRLEDAGSGTILHLEVWEDYLVGSAQDWGSFVFKLKPGGVEPLLPVAEYQLPAGDYRSLFLIEDETGKHQAILPDFSQATGDFAVNPLFTTPITLAEGNGQLNAQNLPQITLQSADGKEIKLDLATGAVQ